MKNSVVEVKVSSGQSYKSEHLQLDSGKVLSCALYSNSNPSSPVSVRIKSKQGDHITPLLPFEDFKPTNGAYMASRKPVTVNVQNIIVEAVAKSNLTQDWSFQLVFDIDDSEIDN